VIYGTGKKELRIVNDNDGRIAFVTLLFSPSDSRRLNSDC